MKAFKILAILTLSCFLFWFCSKKLFGHVEMHGKVLKSGTNTPISATIELWGNDEKGTKEGTYLGQTGSNGDGTFDLKTDIASSEIYYLYIEPYDTTQGTVLRPSLKDGHNVDLGNIMLR